MINTCGLSVKEIIPTGFGYMVNMFTNLTAFQYIYVCEAI